VALIVSLAAATDALAADRSADLAAALRERGWHDTAVEFLDWAEKSPLATDKFRAALPYQRALSRAAQAGQTRSRVERERMLGQAAADFQTFAKSQPASDAGLDALRQAANLLASQAFSTLAEGERLPEQAATQRREARQKARESFDKAAEAAQQIIDISTKELAGLPKAAVIAANPQAKARRDELRLRQVEGRFLAAQLSFERAKTFDPKSKEFAETFDEASRRFGELVEQYGADSVVGTSSRFYQGRCAQEVGAYEKALGCYEDVIPKPPSADPNFRTWTAKAYRRQAECLMALDKLDDAIRNLEEWLAGSRPAERQQPEWLEVAFTLAKAYQSKLEAGAEGSEARRLQGAARTLLRDASQNPNEFQQQARIALASLGQTARDGVEVKTFDDAFSAANTALGFWNSASLAARLARENNPEAVDELQQQADENRAEALRLFELAVDLADRQTPVEQLNTTRYYLSVMYLEEKRLHEAAVLADFLCTRYPESQLAADAAKVALAAYEQLAIEARRATNANAGGGGNGSAANESASFEARKLAQIAELVAARWPETREAAMAANVLIQTALRENRLADAEALLNRLPAESRGAAELSLGAGLWLQYSRMIEGQRDAPTEAALALREKAGVLLTKGFAGYCKAGNPTSSGAVGAINLVQYLLAKGDAQSAIEVLENESVGPLALVESKADIAARPEFVQAAYKAALSAYLSADPPRRKDAERMMMALEEFVAQQGGNGASEKLTAVYLSLGAQLQRQMKELTDAGQDEKARQVAAAFGDVLDRVAARPDAESWQIRSWLAQTNLQIGQALRGEESRKYAERAKTAYNNMLAAAAKNKSYAPNPTAILVVRMRLGECLAALGQHEKAIEQYGEILRERPNMIDLQQAAAVALQEWGVGQRNPAALDQAIRGTLPQKDGKNLIWGWLRLATMADAHKRQAAKAAGDPEAQQKASRYEDLFFEARLNVVKSRYLAGTISTEPKRGEQLRAARANIEQMKRLYPELGGPKWKAAFDALAQQIEKELAKK